MLFTSSVFEGDFTFIDKSITFVDKKQHYWQRFRTCIVPCAGDPPVPSDYEHLKIQDVGMRSVYSGFSPYVYTRQDADKAAGEQDSVACYVNSG